MKPEDAFQAFQRDKNPPANPLRSEAPRPNDVGVVGGNDAVEEPPLPSTPPAGPIPPPSPPPGLPEGAASSPVPSPSSVNAEPASPKWDPLRPSCPQVEWDPAIDESQRPRGLTPEADAYWAYHKAMQDANPGKDDKSIPSTVEDSPNDKAMVCISDDESDLPRQDLSRAFEEAAEKQGSSGLLLDKNHFRKLGIHQRYI